MYKIADSGLLSLRSRSHLNSTRSPKVYLPSFPMSHMSHSKLGERELKFLMENKTEQKKLEKKRIKNAV